jgi:hypothetical protein
MSVEKTPEYRSAAPGTDQAANTRDGPTAGSLDTVMRGVMILSFIATTMAGTSQRATSQALSTPPEPSSTVAVAAPAPVPIDLSYVRPTAKTRAVNYAWDALGPRPLVGAALVAGINQWDNSPPEWKQGFEGYSKRFGSDFAIAAVGTTARYGLAEVFREDTVYYRCACSGLFPRLNHAVISTLTARRGPDGHRVFSFPQLVAPYAGSMTAVYGWYPNRFGTKDAFRMGNYTLLSYVGLNISQEFFYRQAHFLLSRMRLNKRHEATDQDSRP